MIVLDTNIVSVVMTPDHPDLPIIDAWRQSLADDDFATTTVTQAEILFGLAIMPDGGRRTRLVPAARAVFASIPVLPFDSAAAEAYATIVAERRRLGRPIGVLDAQIAAIASSVGAAVATRNVPGFMDCGVLIVNPTPTTTANEVVAIYRNTRLECLAWI
ncbi:MAG: type II toxin-antitoxin system VapC family toxin [Propionibacteriaceae bacterium]|nr:type II toxin-antitoxin system VapC family toxin [Propionibacteriaceae bacterium]